MSISPGWLTKNDRARQEGMVGRTSSSIEWITVNRTVDETEVRAVALTDVRRSRRNEGPPSACADVIGAATVLSRESLETCRGVLRVHEGRSDCRVVIISADT